MTQSDDAKRNHLKPTRIVRDVHHDGLEIFSFVLQIRELARNLGWPNTHQLSVDEK